eukprot:UN32278
MWTRLKAGYSKKTFAEHQSTVYQVASALTKAGLKKGDRISSLMFNNSRHFALYHAAPSMGLVINPCNVRLHPTELGYILNDAGSKIIFVDEILMGAIKKVDKKYLTKVEKIVVCGMDETESKTDHGENATTWGKFIETGSKDKIVWPSLNENAGCTLCYTSGTTGKPKGVVYSHRAIYLHTMGILAGPTFSLTIEDCVLPVVPMFHVMCWGIPFMVLAYGFNVVWTNQYLQPVPLLQMFRDCKVNISFGVPTIWQAMIPILEKNENKEWECLRGVLTRLTVGGSAVPLSLIKYFYKSWGIEIIQGWGMTETGPVGTISRHINKISDKELTEDERFANQAKAGIPFPGIELKIVNPDKFDEDRPNDGKAVGELLIKGPWVTTSYFKDAGKDKFHDGYLVTGDISSISATSMMKIEDRSKDLIKIWR